MVQLHVGLQQFSPALNHIKLFTYGSLTTYNVEIIKFLEENDSLVAVYSPSCHFHHLDLKF